MTFDELQKTWQSHQDDCKLNIDSQLLLKEVQRNKKCFDAAIFWRDVREGGGSIIMSVLMIYFCGIKGFMWPFGFWPMLIPVLLIASVGIFIIIDRFQKKKKLPEPQGPLVGCVEDSLAEVEHQIWLLKNVFWWYLLPLGAAVTYFYIYIGWQLRDLPLLNLLIVGAMFLVTAIFYCYIYRMNQKAIRKELDPRKAELEQLRNSLTLTENPGKATERG